MRCARVGRPTRRARRRERPTGPCLYEDRQLALTLGLFPLSAMLICRFGTRRVCGFRNFEAPPAGDFFRWRLQDDLEHAVIELRFRAVGEGAFRQRHDSIKTAVSAFAAVVPFTIFLVFFATFV